MQRPVLSTRNAFPEAQPKGYQDSRGDKPGMTLRQYYAGLAMQGVLTRRTGFENPDQIARTAVQMADALLLELTK